MFDFARVLHPNVCDLGPLPNVYCNITCVHITLKCVSAFIKSFIDMLDTWYVLTTDES